MNTLNCQYLSQSIRLEEKFIQLAEMMLMTMIMIAMMMMILLNDEDSNDSWASAMLLIASVLKGMPMLQQCRHRSTLM